MRAPSYDELSLESFFVEIIAPTKDEARRRLDFALSRTPIGGRDARGFEVGDVPSDPRRPLRHAFEVLTSGVKMSPGDAWIHAHALAADLQDAIVEPTFDHAEPPKVGPAAESFGKVPRDPATLPPVGWHLERMNVARAHAWLAERGIVPGKGIRIGHPDTGYSKHVEIWDPDAPAFDVARGKNFVEGDDSPLDRLDRGFLLQPGHGTATSSVVVAREKISAEYDEDRARLVDLRGIAPHVTIVPIRVTRTVVILGWQRRLAKAIEHAVDQGCDIVSMSLGGIGGARLESAIAYAEAKGVIVVCAAGNVFPYVVAPAVYPTVVACAASTVDDAPWASSASGRAVDITAPGHDVWIADFDDEGQPVARPGSGTSFATAAVAGAAALWKCAHRAELAMLPTPALVPALFRRALADSARTDPRLTPGRFGAGLLDCGALVANGVPSRASLESGGTAGAASMTSMKGYVLDAMLGGGAPTESPFVAKTFDEGARAELAFHLAIDPDLRARWRRPAREEMLVPEGASPRLKRSIRTLASAPPARASRIATTNATPSAVRITVDVRVRVETW